MTTKRVKQKNDHKIHKTQIHKHFFFLNTQKVLSIDLGLDVCYYP